MLGTPLLRAIGHLYPFYSGATRLLDVWPFRNARLPAGDRWVTTSAGAELLIPVEDFVGRSLYFLGDLDPKVTWVCRRVVRPGDVVLDIGANLGCVTAVLSQAVGPRGAVHAFEPNPVMVGRLRQSAERNRWTNVTFYDYALGDKPGVANLVVPSDNAGSATLAAGVKDGQQVTVAVKRLSDADALNDVRHVRLVKLDVEGFEPQVLHGAGDFFRRVGLPDVIVFEWGFEARSVSGTATVDLLNELGFGFFEIARSYCSVQLRGEPIERIRRSSRSDFIAVPRDHRYSEIKTLLGAR